MLDSRVIEHGVRWGIVGAGSPADKRGRETPGESDEDEAEDIVEEGGLVVGHVESVRQQGPFES